MSVGRVAKGHRNRFLTCWRSGSVGFQSSGTEDDAIGSFTEGAALVTGRQGQHRLLPQRRGPISRHGAGTPQQPAAGALTPSVSFVKILLPRWIRRGSDRTPKVLPKYGAPSRLQPRGRGDGGSRVRHRPGSCSSCVKHLTAAALGSPRQGSRHAEENATLNSASPPVTAGDAETLRHRSRGTAWSSGRAEDRVPVFSYLHPHTHLGHCTS
ncbi:hypothetical protein PAL_GLEAN10004916 [Pteropus alecto]|uniref:Uncharacterized protein n=1 Tax=Pteropus alecto TaxID=9402 RepID=L5KL76_PTEAL|nr:hypothetical protein PAL_GLEAN10004916 [Pteropus alecto]